MSPRAFRLHLMINIDLLGIKMSNIQTNRQETPLASR